MLLLVLDHPLKTIGLSLFRQWFLIFCVYQNYLGILVKTGSNVNVPGTQYVLLALQVMLTYTKIWEWFFLKTIRIPVAE